MSRQATFEYVGQQRRIYCAAKNWKKRKAILTNFCEVAGYNRKYANKLLTGNRRFRLHPGRGRTYGQKALELAETLWKKTGCVCPQYLVARMDRHLADFKEISHVPPECEAQLRKVSVSTLARHLRGKAREKPGSLRRAYSCVSRNNALGFVAVRSGELDLAATAQPGEIQVDTVALCGGDMSGNFFWILTLTDRRTQWTEIRPVWNRGAEGVFEALSSMIGVFPFPAASLHYDNGCEFMNSHLANFAATHPGISHARSRTGKCNDNAHVEEKNGSIVRELFGELRYDRPELKETLWNFCEEWSRYINICKCSVMLTSRVKRLKAKGCRKTYDAPQTPAERTAKLIRGIRAERLEKATNTTNGMILRERLLLKFRRIKRIQFKDSPGVSAVPELGASRRPSGDVPIPRTHPNQDTTDSVQYLTHHLLQPSSKRSQWCLSI